jgi:hypothetical protein
MKRKIETYCCYVLQVFWSSPTTTYISIKKIPICVTNVPTNFVEMMLRLISNVQYATLQKYFSHPNLVIYLFIPNPNHKIRIRLQIGGRLLIANHLDQSLWLINKKHGVSIRSYLLHASLANVKLCNAFLSTSKKFLS